MDAAVSTTPDAFLARIAEVQNTPTFVYNEREIHRLLALTEPLRTDGLTDVLFSTKALPFAPVIKLMTPHLDGFATSSLFEARLAHEAAGPTTTIHYTSPGLRPDEVDEIAQICDFVSFNSIEMWERHRVKMMTTSCGLRVNAQFSFLDDERYDPCRRHSKLGIPLDTLIDIMEHQPERLKGLQGIHVHTNCDATNMQQLASIVEHLSAHLDWLLRQLLWINLGGGYLFSGPDDVDETAKALEALQTTFGLRVIIEPGAALIRTAGYIVASVLDLFESEGQRIAILDTTVNHMPEVFEYGYEPLVAGHHNGAPHGYILAGCTCLAGDLFGTYQFHKPLTVGSRVVFPEVGAYTLPKAHTFNGVNFPDIEALTPNGNLVVKKRFHYKDYLKRWGQDASL